jgi:nitroimidazol reductase NimA-like FMN-containing flavoprotein (pyridoxamine 5'-phosphate oxidase superfamily)
VVLRPCRIGADRADNRHVPDTPALSQMNDTIDPLSEAECRRLLGTQTLGRVGITKGGLPLILPVHYLYDDGVIVFRTGAGTKLRAAEGGDVLAFEVDTYDYKSGRGWSVLVLGRASVVTTAHEAEDLPTLDDPRGDGERNHYIRLFCELVTGRVIETAQP